MALSAGHLAETPLDLFETVVGHLCDELGKIIFELSAALDHIEERIVSDSSGAGERATLGVTRRSALRLAREIAGLRSPLFRLEAMLSEPEHDELKETGARLAHRVDILAHDLAEMQDRARLLQDELNPRSRTSSTNDRLYILTVRDDAAAAGDFCDRLLRHEHAQSALSRTPNGARPSLSASAYWRRSPCSTSCGAWA